MIFKENCFFEQTALKREVRKKKTKKKEKKNKKNKKNKKKKKKKKKKNTDYQSMPDRSGG